MKLKATVLIVLTTFISSFIGCSEKKEKVTSQGEDGWVKEAQVLKTIENVHFNFPASGYAFDNKNDLTTKCFEAMESNLQLIKLDKFTDTIQIRFLKSRADMTILTGVGATGIAQPSTKTLYVVSGASEKVKPPIKHELMHLITMLEWGYPHPNATWLNEGLASFAEDNCNGYNVTEIYRYLMENEKLIHIDALTKDFYNQPEMITYHQSAYIVKHLINNHSIDQFKRLWTEGFNNFESIYNMSFQEMKTKLEMSVTKQYPNVPNIDWETFKEGCIN